MALIVAVTVVSVALASFKVSHHPYTLLATVTILLLSGLAGERERQAGAPKFTILQLLFLIAALVVMVSGDPFQPEIAIP